VCLLLSRVGVIADWVSMPNFVLRGVIADWVSMPTFVLRGDYSVWAYLLVSRGPASLCMGVMCATINEYWAIQCECDSLQAFEMSHPLI